MLSSTMVTLDRLLGIIEVIAVPVSLWWLAVAWLAPAAKRTRRAVVLALIVGLTVAQPFGIVAVRQNRLPPTDARLLPSRSVHVARLFGVIPLLPFELYPRTNCWTLENRPSATLRARSWFWLPVLTNSTDVKDMCSNSKFDPCCESADANASRRKALSVDERDGVWVVLRNMYPVASNIGVPQFYVWKLEPGIASFAGLAYWIVTGGLLLVILRTHRKEARIRSPRATGRSRSSSL